MNLKKIRDKIQNSVEKSAWTLGGLKAYERVRVELVIWAFLFLTGSLALITEIIFIGFSFRFYTYLFLIGISCLSFLGKSVQYRRFKMLNAIMEAQNENRNIKPNK